MTGARSPMRLFPGVLLLILVSTFNAYAENVYYFEYSIETYEDDTAPPEKVILKTWHGKGKIRCDWPGQTDFVLLSEDKLYGFIHSKKAYWELGIKGIGERLDEVKSGIRQVLRTAQPYNGRSVEG